MRLTLPRSASLLFCALMPAAALGQAAGIILAQPQLRLQSSNPFDNGSTTDFGAAVALDGNVLVVGAPREDSTDMGNDDAGAVWIYERQGMSWVEQQRLTAPVETPLERFGSSVGVALGDDDLDFLVVGAPGFSGNTGAVYLYRREGGGSWVFETDLFLDSSSGGDWFGRSVAIDYFAPPNDLDGEKDFIIVAGAPFAQVAPAVDRGVLAVFQRAGGPPTWDLTHEFFGDSDSDLNGSSVAIGGPYIIAGAEGEDEAFFNAGGGNSYVQANFGGTTFVYNPVHRLLPTNPQTGAAIEQSAALDKNPVFWGTGALGFASHDASQSAIDSGIVYIFDAGHPMGGNLNAATSLELSSPVSFDKFGASVAMSAGVLAIGAPGVGDNGTVFFYTRGATITDWTLVGDLEPEGLQGSGDCAYGEAAALFELTAAVGCPDNSFEDRGVYLYDAGVPVFFDGFETGDTERWSAAVP